ncbi:MAG: hypothetical protein Ta2A_23090 [Treponemataceae bacterium]|nr:MAG: hypothetical protein Ta2A_23090 [Treponemataceae bacterium]
MQVKSLFALVLLLMLSMLSVSCATAVYFEVTHPPLADMRGVKKITVQVEQPDRKYRYLEADLVRVLTKEVLRQNRYTFIDSAVLRTVDQEAYQNYVDAYIMSAILDVQTSDRREETEVQDESDSSKTQTKVTVTRTVTVEIACKYVRADTGKVLGVFTKTASASESFDDSPPSFTGIAILDVLNVASFVAASGPATETLAKRAVRNFSPNMARELSAWTTVEQRMLKTGSEKSTKDSFRSASKLAGQKKYSDALDLYKVIYARTGDINAGYNAALLLEATHRFADALKLLEEMQKTGYAPYFVTNEIAALRTLIADLATVAEYKD